MKISLIQAKCIACGICVKVCPMGILEIQEKLD
ncbi:4Fe-4S binding protein [Clostridium thailandense]